MEPFEALVHRHQHAIYAFALNLTGSPAEADEVAQEAFIRAWRAYGGYDEARRQELNERPWLFRIALNVFRNRLRARREQAPLSDETAAAPSAQQPEQVALSNARRRELRGHLVALPRPYREAVVLHHVQGLAYEEAAEVLGLPVGTVKSNCHRGVRRIQERMQLREVS